MTLPKLIAFIKLTRPLFLAGAAIVYALGVFIARSQGITLDLSRALLGQAIITSIQLMTHYSNEYYDLETDQATGLNRTLFSGGSGILPSGVLSPRVAYRAMITCAIISLILIGITSTQVPLIAPLCLIGLTGAWFYSAPPLRLVSSGWGEVASSIIVTILTPLIGYAMQTMRLDLSVLGVGLPLALLYLAMVTAFEIPDYDADAATNKRTLAVRWGRTAAGWLQIASMIIAFLLIIIFGWRSARLVWFVLPLIIWQMISIVWRIKHTWTHLGWFTLGGIAVFAFTASAWLIGFIL